MLSFPWTRSDALRVKLHREVVKTLSELRNGIRVRIIQGLRALKDDSIHPRPGADIVRLRGTTGRISFG